MDDGPETSRRPRPRTVLFGCLGCSGALVLMLGVAVVLNLDAFQEPMEVRSALREELGIDADVGPHWDLGSGGTSLQIDVLGPDLRGKDPGAKAREIAVLAAKVLSSPEDFDRVEVRFVNRIGRAIHFETSREYEFPMSELLLREHAGSDD